MIPGKIEAEIWAGRAEMITQTFGFGEQFVVKVNPNTFVILTGFSFSPRAWPIDTGNVNTNLNFLIQSLNFSTLRKSANFIYKPLFNKIRVGNEDFYSANVIQENDLYFVADEDLSIYTYMADISQVAETLDTLPETGLLRPNLTAANRIAGVQYLDVLPGINYAPLQTYGEEIGYPEGQQRDLILTPFNYTPVLADPSNFPFLTVNYALFKYTRPKTLS